MLNFAVGPVQMSDEVRSIGSEQIPYFRTTEFSRIMLENERLLLDLAGAPACSRAVFLTASGTGAMEAAVMGLLGPSDRALVVDGGSFGHRFVQLCEVHGIPHEALRLTPGSSLTAGDLAPFGGAGFTAFLVNLDETSTGVLYDLDLIGAFCKREGLFLVVDAISSFLADPIDMEAAGIGALVVGSQKAPAVAPGISALALAPNALGRIDACKPATLYFDLKRALLDGERGQTPFTPAVGVLLQLNARLGAVAKVGLAAEIGRVAALAGDFRSRIADTPFSLFAHTPSNAVTSLATNGASAKLIFETLQNEYGIWVCPNGGRLADSVFRVGHIGALSIEDNIVLVEAFRDLARRGLLERGTHA